MLSKRENDLLCHVEPGSPMGDTLRRYWWPVLMSSELVERGRACVPQRVTMFGETFVAFRGEDGAVAILDEHCPHRGASLVLGVVDGCAIRCLYHAWAMNGAGCVVEAPNVEPGRTRDNVLARVKTRAYPAREAGGLIWAYFGPAEKQPLFPDYQWFSLPEQNRLVTAVIFDANYLQSAENLVDPTHLAVLHQDPMKKQTSAIAQETASSVMTTTAPKIEVQSTPFGFRLAAIRRHGDGQRVRPVNVVAPTSMFIPAYPRPNAGGLLCFVPVSNTRTMQFTILWDEERLVNEEPLRDEILNFFGIHPKITDAFGISRSQCDSPNRASPANNFRQDRVAILRGDTASGFPDFIPEDVAVIVSQGEISDRTAEHLVPADLGVTQLRRMLLDAVRRVQEGSDPIGIDPNLDTYTILAHEYNIPENASWQDSAPVRNRVQARSSNE